MGRGLEFIFLLRIKIDFFLFWDGTGGGWVGG